MKEALHRLLNRLLPRGGLARNASIVAGGTALSQGIAIASAPVLTRLFAPSDFGALQVFISLMSLVLVAAAGRYELAVLLPEDEQSAIDVLAVAAFSVCGTTALSVVAALLCQRWWLLPTSMLVLRPYLWLLPFSILGGGLYQVLNYWAMRRKDYTQIAKSKMTQAGSMVGVQLAGGLATHGPLMLLCGDAVGRMAGSGRFLSDLLRNEKERLRRVRPGRMAEAALRYRDFPMVSMWGALVNASGLALPALFLAQYYGATGTGWFALVNRVMGVPAALIGLSIAQVYTAEAARLSKSDPKRLLGIFLRTARRMAYLGLVPCLLFALLAPWLFQFVFGHAWREAGVYARYLALMFFASFIDSPVTMTLNILERQRAQLAWDLTRLVVTIGAIGLPYYLGHGPAAAILAYGVAMTAMYAVHWTQSYLAIRKCVAGSEARLVQQVEG